MSRRSKSADRQLRLVASEGRRVTAPPRRMAGPANDNKGPLALRLKKAAFLVVLAVMAAATVWMGSQ